MIHNGDSIDVLQTYPDSHFDLVCTDPPYGLAFMGKSWDRALPSLDLFKEVNRVLKPGAFAFVMCSPRQDVHARMIILLEDAGFLTGFTSLIWAYASGFNKSLNISKAIDKKYMREWITEHRPYAMKLFQRIYDAKPKDHWCNLWIKLAEEKYGKIKGRREVVGKQILKGNSAVSCKEKGGTFVSGLSLTGVKEIDITASATDDAKRFDGSYGGLQMKPAFEMILVVQKPMTEKTYVDQALKNGHGITWLGTKQNGESGCIPYESEGEPTKMVRNGDYTKDREGFLEDMKIEKYDPNPSGRFAPSLLVSDDILDTGEVSANGRPNCEGKQYKEGKKGDIYGKYKNEFNSFSSPNDSGGFSRYFSLESWFADTIKKLPPKIRKVLPFIIVPKPSKEEKNRGCESLPLKDRKRHPLFTDMSAADEDWKKTHPNLPERNTHPTCKSLDLFSYLLTIGSRPGDVILDPFLGSGTTCVAAKMLGRSYVGIELAKEYYDIARARLDAIDNALLEI